MLILIENVTVQERYDEATSRSTHMILEHKSDKYQPALVLLMMMVNEVAQYYLPAGSI